MSNKLEILTPSRPRAEVLPQKAAAFIEAVKSGQEVTAAMQAAGLNRRDLSTQQFKDALEEYLVFVPDSDEQARRLIRGFLWKKMLTSPDDKTALDAAAKLQKDASLGFVEGATSVEISVMSPEIKALAPTSPWDVDKTIDITPAKE